ncbi:MAG: hypothetical protein N2690_00140 [Rhodocyclaceae bacterium]|nr:hypothetical protein [Rhodocyclaceae bacterium]
MALLKAVATMLVPASVVYGVYVLWPQSHCDRLHHAAWPAYAVGQLAALAAQPLVSDQQEVQQWPQRLRALMGEGVAWVFYGRSLQQVCASDAIVWLRQHQRLDERGLLRAVPQPQAPAPAPQAAPTPAAPGAAAPASRATSAAQSTWQAPAQHSTPPAANHRVWFIVASVLLLGVVVALLLFPALLGRLLRGAAELAQWLWQACFAGLRHLLKAHAQVLEHLLPRAVVRPSAGKDRADRTDL